MVLVIKIKFLGPLVFIIPWKLLTYLNVALVNRSAVVNTKKVSAEKNSSLRTVFFVLFCGNSVILS